MTTAFNQSIWGDEGFSAILSMKSLPDLINTISKDTSPPLWNLFEWSAFKIFGASEIVIRSLSLTFFLITIFFVFLITKKLWDKKTAVLASVLTFLNPFFFIYAFEGRMYSIMAAGVAGSMYFFLKRKWTPYVIFTLWALYSHHFAIFAVIFQGFWFLYEYFFGERKKIKGAFKAFIAVAIGYSPWLLPLYNQTKMVGGGFWLATPTTTDLRNVLFDYLGEGIKHKLTESARILVLAALALRAWEKDIKKTFFLALWFLFPILATWLISQQFSPIFYNRYLLYTIPGAMILLASNRRKLFNFLIAIIILLFVIIDWNYFVNPSKIPFKDLAVYVKQTQTEKSLIINEDAGSHKLWESKFYNIPAPIYNPTKEELPYFVGTALMEDSDFISEIPMSTDKLGIITYKDGDEVEKRFKKFSLMEEKRFGELNFVWLVRD
ncbi:glycosyltransferase family 39 protein [Candidatus Microgenomates bacterium]|nr:glycosyltransferase family 39 protein [Candidatus Microgenomates bacterium]